MMDTYYADDQSLFTSSPVPAESQMHIMEQAAGDIGLCINANKTVYMCFKVEGAISTLSGKLLKSVDQFMYLGSNISSTESNVNIHIEKASASIDRLLIILKFDLFVLYIDL